MPIPKRLGKYEILEEIGRGGFAVVYKARDTTLDRVVALKVLHPQLTTDPKFVQRFHQEAQTAARLHHPHIVTIHEIGEEAGQHYLAMAFLPGRTLDERLSATRGPLPVELAVSIAEQIADALDTIHQQGLVHRDVKPANIMVDKKGWVTLLDFGIVRAAEGTRLTTSMAVLGTPEYMAPEQAELREGAEIDWRADVYALGVVTYEMLVGRPPFTGQSPTAILHKHVYEPPPAPTTLNPGLPTGLEPVLLKALAKVREGRFQSADGFAVELRRALPGDSQIQRREARLAPLYRQMQAAAAQRDWAKVLALGSQIEALDASYRDVSQWMAHARQQLRQPRGEPAQPPRAQPMPRERTEEPERKVRRTPALNWRVAGLSALVVVVCIGLIAGLLFCPISYWPWAIQTPADKVGPVPTLTATVMPTSVTPTLITPTSVTPTSIIPTFVTPTDIIPSEVTCVPDATFVADVTIPDGTEIPAGKPFVKTWRVQNTGDCDWEAGTLLAFVSGDLMGGAGSVAVEAVGVGATSDVSVSLVAPTEPGAYTGNWQLQTSDGINFGPVLSVEIIVKPLPISGIWSTFTAEDGLFGDSVLAIAVGPDDALWFGTNLGVSCYDPTADSWQAFATADGLAGHPVQAIAVGPDGTIWFGTRGDGASRYDPVSDIWQTYTAKDGLADVIVSAIVVGPDGALWFGTQGGGVSRYDPNADAWQTFTTKDGLADNEVSAIAVGPDGALWFGTHSSVSRYDPVADAWQVFTTSDGLLGVGVKAIAVGPDATLWFGASGGVSHYDPGTDTWSTFATSDGLVDDHVLAVAAGPDGNLWFGTWGGVSCYDPDTGSWQSFTTKDGLASNYVHAIAKGLDRTLWFGTYGGVSCFEPTSL